MSMEDWFTHPSSVRLMKRDLLFIPMQAFPLLNEWQLHILAWHHGIRKGRETEMLDQLFSGFLWRFDEGTHSRYLSRFVLSLLQGEVAKRLRTASPPRFTRWTPTRLPSR